MGICWILRMRMCVWYGAQTRVLSDETLNIISFRMRFLLVWVAFLLTGVSAQLSKNGGELSCPELLHRILHRDAGVVADDDAKIRQFLGEGKASLGSNIARVLAPRGP